MRIRLHFDGLSTLELRRLLATCSKTRDGFSPTNHGGLPGAEPWMPVVCVEGPECYGAIVPPCDPSTAAYITGEMQK